MLDDLQKSIRLVLSERITSPFSGAFIFSWCVWNWRIPYYLFFESGTVPAANRAQFVLDHYLDWWVNLGFPAASAAILVTVYPFITTGALWIWLRFKKWQTDIRNSVDQRTLLTLEQSLALRLEMNRRSTEVEKLLAEKDSQIAQKQLLIEGLQTAQTSAKKQVSKRDPQQETTSIAITSPRLESDAIEAGRQFKERSLSKGEKAKIQRQMANLAGSIRMLLESSARLADQLLRMTSFRASFLDRLRRMDREISASYVEGEDEIIDLLCMKGILDVATTGTTSIVAINSRGFQLLALLSEYDYLESRLQFSIGVGSITGGRKKK
jgi:hypothetical protein